MEEDGRARRIAAREAEREHETAQKALDAGTAIAALEPESAISTGADGTATAVLEPEKPDTEEEEAEIDAGEQKKWERDLSQIRRRIEGEFEAFTELQWQIALRLMYGMSMVAIVSELGVASNTIARLRNMAKYEALAATFGKHHLAVAGYNARVELRRRTTSKMTREGLQVKDLIAIDKAAGVLAGPMQVKQGPQVQIFLNPLGAAGAADNPTLAGMVLLRPPQALEAPPGDEEVVEAVVVEKP